MAYEIFVDCDESNCPSRAQVPQVGASPTGWVMMKHAKPAVMTQAGNAQDAVVALVFCGWPCVVKYAKGFILPDEFET